MTLLNKVEKQFTYWKTVKALKSLPNNIATDIGVDVYDAEKIARRAVWG